jgi:hypothetical protein
MMIGKFPRRLFPPHFSGAAWTGDKGSESEAKEVIR